MHYQRQEKEVHAFIYIITDIVTIKPPNFSKLDIILSIIKELTLAIN